MRKADFRLAALAAALGLASAPRRRSLIRRGRSPWWCRSRPAGRPTRWRASSASACAQSLGQTIVIENTTGAAGSIGVGRVVRAAPDGYTLSIGHWSTHVVNGAIYPLNYDLLEGSRSGRAAAGQSAAHRHQAERAGEGSQGADRLGEGEPGQDFRRAPRARAAPRMSAASISSRSTGTQLHFRALSRHRARRCRT